jgi:hypothetical protein
VCFGMLSRYTASRKGLGVPERIEGTCHWPSLT